MADKKAKPGGGSSDMGLYIIIGIMIIAITVFGITQPIFNTDSAVSGVFDFFKPIFDFIINPHTWTVLGIVSSSISIFFIGVIIFSLVRMREIQIHEKHELEHEIREALIRDQEAIKNDNPRWHYILTLIESPNESDWRVAIIEADTMLDETLEKKGMIGETLSEKLEQARSNGYASIQGAWDAHIIRNQIAHQGLDFPITQIEGRRVIRMYQSLFEELGVI